MISHSIPSINISGLCWFGIELGRINVTSLPRAAKYFAVSNSACSGGVFRFDISYKTYLRNCIKASKEESSIDVVKQVVKEFDDFISSNNVNVIRNSRFNYDNDLAEVISDHYQLLNIKISKDLLDEGNLESLIKDLKVMINSYYLEDMGLNIDLINNLFDSKKIINKSDS